MFEKMRLYHALLTLYVSNLRVIHWTVSGKGFHTSHARYQTYYETLYDYIDETAEALLSMGQRPVSVFEAIRLVRESNIDGFILDGTENLCPEIGDKHIMKMFDQLYDLSEDLADEDDLPVDVSDIFMGHAKYFRLEGKYKLGRRFATPTKPDQDEPHHVAVTTPDVPVVTADSIGNEDQEE